MVHHEPDGRLLAVVSSPGADFGKRGTIAAIDIADLHVVRRIRYEHGTPEAMSFSPNGATLAVSTE